MADMNSGRRARFALLFVLVALVVSVLQASPALAEVNGCSANIQNPHVSQSHGGIDVTGVWKCSEVPTTIQFNFTASGGLFLFLCPEKGRSTETWVTNHCTIKGINADDIPITTAGNSGAKDRVAPHTAEPAAHGSGWWIACATWRSVGPSGTSPKHVKFSNWVQISG